MKERNLFYRKGKPVHCGIRRTTKPAVADPGAELPKSPALPAAFPGRRPAALSLYGAASQAPEICEAEFTLRNLTRCDFSLHHLLAVQVSPVLSPSFFLSLLLCFVLPCFSATVFLLCISMTSSFSKLLYVSHDSFWASQTNLTRSYPIEDLNPLHSCSSWKRRHLSAAISSYRERLRVGSQLGSGGTPEVSVCLFALVVRAAWGLASY